MKKIEIIIAITTIGLTIGCSSSKMNTRVEKKDEGNKVIVKGEALDFSDNNQDEIVFKGEGNTIILEYFNTFFNDKNSADVIIVEGDGNVFKLSHSSGIDNSENSSDTIVLKGNQNHLEILQSYFMDNSENSNGKKVFELDNYFELTEVTHQATVFDSSKVENQITNKMMFVHEAFEIYQKESMKGNNIATYYLGEMYQVGVGVKMNIKKAEYYYLIAAKKGNKEAQIQLGYIYEDDYEGVKADYEKSKYWYTKAAAQGDEYAIERLESYE